MPETQTRDLFAVAGSDPVAEWAEMLKQCRKFEPSLLKLWKDEYEAWKHRYQLFRDQEQRTFYTATESGSVPSIPSEALRFHRATLLALMQAGESCETHLSALPLDGEEAQERLMCQRRIRTLLDSLQETFELWHPVNIERVEERRSLVL